MEDNQKDGIYTSGLGTRGISGGAGIGIGVLSGNVNFSLEETPIDRVRRFRKEQKEK